MIDDPTFYALAALAVAIVGISKGGFGGGLGIMAVPVLSLAVSPITAAAVMLPILCLMDVTSALIFRKNWDGANLRVLLPGAIAGIALGALTFRFMNEDVIRLMIGLISVLFTLNWAFAKGPRTDRPARPVPALGVFLGGVAGYTSFVAHAGSPPLIMYLMSQRLDKSVFHATAIVFFTVVNYTKLIPYAYLGLFDAGNLTTSLVILPLVPAGVVLGVWMHNRVSQNWFYRICYGFLFVTGVKLVFDGVGGIFVG